MKVNYITFCNTGYMPTDRILSEAASFNIFDTIKCYNEYDISGFIETHKDFIRYNPHGYGLFIWKPKVVEDMLEKMDYGDILLYTDAGCHLNIKGIERFKEYINVLKDDKYDIVAFKTSDYYPINSYLKMDAIMYSYPPLASKLYQYYYAGLILIKKTERSMKCIKEYLDLCTHYNFIDRSPSVIHPESNIFCGQDGDNSLYGLCINKYSELYNNIYFISHNEVNLYLESGEQNYYATDWSSLDAYPLQCRRLTPKWPWKKLDSVN